MSIIHDKWLSGWCRVEDGIFFGNGGFVALQGRPQTGYLAAERQPINLLIDAAPNGWGRLNETVACVLQERSLNVDAGETSWEGEGVVVVSDAVSGQLVWLLHLCVSEPFIKVAADGNVIRATSGGYPSRFEWSIPIDAPEKFSVECHSAD